MPSPSAGVAGVFDRAADTYDAVGVPWFGPIAQGLADQLGVRSGERVLDVGTGRGALLSRLARAAGPAGQLVGIDLSARMVELTAADFADHPNVAVRVGDASQPGEAAGSFDVVAASLVVFFLPDPLAALRAWVDLLGKGGRVGISTFAGQDKRMRRVDEVFEPYLPAAMLDARTSGRAGPFASDAGVEGLFRSAGLLDVRTAHRRVEVEFADGEQVLAFTWSHGQRAMWEAIPDAVRPAVRQRVLAVVSELQGEPEGLRVWQDIRYTLGRRE